MKLRHVLSPVLAAVVFLGVVSCSDQSPTAPERAAITTEQAPLLLGDLTNTLSDVSLLRCTPMPTARAQAWIGPNGGRIDVGPHSLVVPPGALTHGVLIRAEAPRDNVNRVEFQPHGLEFNRPARITMSYANCQGLASLLPRRIVYIDGNLNLLEVLESVTNLREREVSARLEHFSDYAVAW